MKTRMSVGSWAAMIVTCTLWLPVPVAGQGSPSPLPPVDYPETQQAEVSDDYHGTFVSDPYRWLEDPDSAETRAWVDAQNQVTRHFLDDVSRREAIQARLETLWNYERFGLPQRRRDRLFYEYNDGLLNQDRLMVAFDGQMPRILLDPNTLSSDGTVDLAQWIPSDDGEHVALGFATAGSDWIEWRVLKVDSGQMLDDQVRWSKFSGAAWSADHAGFYYARYDEPQPGQEFTQANYFQKLYYHRLGTAQAEDVLVYERPDQKEWGFEPKVTEDGRYLAVSVWKGTLSQNQFFYRDLSTPDAPMVELLAGFDAEYQFVGNRERVFYFLTDHNAPLRRLIAIDIDNPDPSQWSEIVPARSVVALQATFIGNKFVLTYLQDARSVARVHSVEGKFEREVELPGIGEAVGFNGRSDRAETFYAFQSFTTPTTLYRYDVVTGESLVFRRPKAPFNPDDYETSQVFYQSKDGTRVPLFLVSKKGIERNGKTPTLLYGYGGFDISITPRFSVTNLTWVDGGGVYAVANLRGGGEYGREWHEAGMLAKKQNVFDDFIAAAEYLIAEKITDAEHLAIHGRSNGGLLVGAVMAQRPELFAAAVPAVGVMDMLRFQKFTIGHAWVSEYGSSDDPEQFKTLFAYSPLHNLKPGTRYPATLVMTADHDDRVVPAHSHKFIARLQECQAADGPPCLIRIETSGGHGAGKPTSMQIAEATDLLSFLVKALQADQ